MTFSLLPLLIAIQFGTLLYATKRAVHGGAVTASGERSILVVLVVLSVWGAVSAVLSLTGTYYSQAFLQMQAPIWLPFVPVALVILPLIFSGTFRVAVDGLIDYTPLTGIIAMHALRVLAIGSILKAARDEFSIPFATYVAAPDFIFGLSAIVMAWLVFKERVGTIAVIMWNLVGILVIVPTANITIALASPGSWQVFTSSPGIMTLYDFPMVLAPTLVVPLFVMMNMFVALRYAVRYWRGLLAFEKAA